MVRRQAVYVEITTDVEDDYEALEHVKALLNPLINEGRINHFHIMNQRQVLEFD